jgi:exodeoxyribonuclease VII large subunit
VDPLHVAQVLAAYNASLAQVFTRQTCTITGILEPKHDTVYGGQLYWYLVDGDARLTVRMPERWQVYRGRRVEVTGQLTPRLWTHRGEIEVVLDVKHMNPLEPPPDDWIGPLRGVGEERRLSWPTVERAIEKQILAGERPRVLMFCGTNAVVGEDVRAALGPHARAYHIDKRQVSLTDAAAVAAALSAQKMDADLVAVVRGGGEGLSALSDRRVIETLARHVSVPVVSAVGHAVDRR